MTYLPFPMAGLQASLDARTYRIELSKGDRAGHQAPTRIYGMRQLLPSVRKTKFTASWAVWYVYIDGA